jgi:hypothetical protein
MSSLKHSPRLTEKTFMQFSDTTREKTIHNICHSFATRILRDFNTELQTLSFRFVCWLGIGKNMLIKFC